MWTKEFWRATAERMIRAAAGAILSVLIVGDGIFNAFDADWENTLGVGLGAMVVSLLLALAGNATTGNGPSFTNQEELTN